MTSSFLSCESALLFFGFVCVVERIKYLLLASKVLGFLDEASGLVFFAAKRFDTCPAMMSQSVSDASLPSPAHQRVLMQL